jgi:putative nucleotidyltransferase with HDIG domain
LAEAIQSLDEHWGGGGYPDGLEGSGIPLFSRIMNLSQTLEVFLVNRGPEAAIDVVQQRSGRWFDPDLVKAAASLAKRGTLWSELEHADAIEHALALEPEERRMAASDETIENICQAFAEIVDAKSPFTYRHSNGVADAAMAISDQLSLSPEESTFLRRAALLHDVGKLSVSNTILEKPAALDADEWKIVKKHPYYSYEILRKIPGFEQLSEVAAAHHEKLDGSGYFRNWGADQLSLPARILVVSDIYDALAAERPYRSAMPLEKVFEIMQKDAPRALDSECLAALMAAKLGSSSSSASLAGLARGVEAEDAQSKQQEQIESVPTTN